MDDDAGLQAIVMRDARARVASMVRALEGSRPSEVAGDLWREAHTLVGIAGVLGEADLVATSRELASLLRDEWGRDIPLTPEAEAAVRRDVELLRTALARLETQP